MLLFMSTDTFFLFLFGNSHDFWKDNVVLTVENDGRDIDSNGAFRCFFCFRICKRSVPPGNSASFPVAGFLCPYCT